MTKQEFVDAVADKAGLTKRDAGTAVDACPRRHREHAAGRRRHHVHRVRQVPRHPARRPAGREPPHRREGADPGCERPEVLGRVAAQEGSELAGRNPRSGFRPQPRRTPEGVGSPPQTAGLRFAAAGTDGNRTCINMCSITIRGMQLSFDAADRLVELVEARRGPVPAEEAARVLFALASAPAALARSLLDDVVSGRRPPRLARDVGRPRRPAGSRRPPRGRALRRRRPRDDGPLAAHLADLRDRRAARPRPRARRTRSRRSSTPASRCRRPSRR